MSLTHAEKESLDHHGYLILADVIDSEWLDRLRASLERALNGGESGGKESGTRHIDLTKDVSFENVRAHPRVLAAVDHVLKRPFRVLQLSGRDPLPGYGQQGLHNDWLPRRPSEPFSVVTALWLLDEFISNNGSTRLVPGSHLVPRPLPKSMQAPENHHPNEMVVVAKAGSVLVFNGHLWHSGTRNRSARPRRVLQCQFVARE